MKTRKNIRKNKERIQTYYIWLFIIQYFLLFLLFSSLQHFFLYFYPIFLFIYPLPPLSHPLPSPPVPPPPPPSSSSTNLYIFPVLFLLIRSHFFLPSIFFLSLHCNIFFSAQFFFFHLFFFNFFSHPEINFFFPHTYIYTYFPLLFSTYTTVTLSFILITYI